MGSSTSKLLSNSVASNDGPGLHLSVYADSGVVYPGQPVNIQVSIYNTSDPFGRDISGLSSGVEGSVQLAIDGVYYQDLRLVMFGISSYGQAVWTASTPGTHTLTVSYSGPDGSAQAENTVTVSENPASTSNPASTLTPAPTWTQWPQAPTQKPWWEDPIGAFLNWLRNLWK